MFPRGPPLFCVWGYWSPLGSLDLVGPLRVRAELPIAGGRCRRRRRGAGRGTRSSALSAPLAASPNFPQPLRAPIRVLTRRLPAFV